jgi:hypothetical protein
MVALLLCLGLAQAESRPAPLPYTGPTPTKNHKIFGEDLTSLALRYPSPTPLCTHHDPVSLRYGVPLFWVISQHFAISLSLVSTIYSALSGYAANNNQNGWNKPGIITEFELPSVIASSLLATQLLLSRTGTLFGGFLHILGRLLLRPKYHSARICSTVGRLLRLATCSPVH